MNTAQSSSPAQLQALQNILSLATQDASSAMGVWTGGSISLSLDCVREIPLEMVSQEFDLGMELLTMVVLTLDAEMGGTMILTFDEENGRKLAATLLKREVNTDPEWDEYEQSALNETGNILGCAYFNAIARTLGFEFVPSPPSFVQDYGVCVLQQALMEQLGDSVDVLICQTTFNRDGEELNWHVLFVPNDNMRRMMRETL